MGLFDVVEAVKVLVELEIEGVCMTYSGSMSSTICMWVRSGLEDLHNLELRNHCEECGLSIRCILQ